MTRKKAVRYTPGQCRMAQDLAVELEHLNKGIPSLIDLYAAAPELLEAAKHALETVRDYIQGGASMETAKVLRSVIAKAEGGK